MAEPTAAPTPGSMTAPSPANMAGPSPSASASASAVPSMSVTDAQAEEWRRRVRAMALQMPEDKFENMKRHMQAMQAAGHTKETSAELARLTFMADYRIADMRKQALEAANTGPVSGNAAPLDPAPGTTLSLGSAAQLRAQKVAFQHLANNMPVPPAILRAANGELATRVGQNSMDMQDLTVDRVVDAVVSDKLEEQAQAGGIEELDGPSASGSASGSQDQTPTGPPYALELDTSSLIYPYNAFNHPAAYGRDYEGEISMPLNKMQRMLVPSTMPQGLDPYILMQERNRYVENRMAWRMKELEEMSSTAGAESGAKEVPGVANGVQETPANIRARIELMSLRLVGKQRLLREDMVRKMHVASAVPADRSQFRRFRTHTIRDARATETAERRQRTEREQRGKQRHLEYIKSICDHGEAVKEAGRGTLRGGEAIKMGRLGRAMLKMHVDIEKEEQRRLEKLAKDRLKALKADDEDAYMALLGEAKDSRIGHLLKQTDSYLETLANNIREQQNDDVHRDGMAQWDAFETEDGPANEAMFGAKRQDGEDDGIEQREGKVDYYAVAHHIQEKVTGQASILTGGTLKDYQVKGLQWMISLYNNRLNGILADEMGLGKTIQTISLITYLIEKKHSPGPFLVIVPLSTLTNWQMEFERWAPSVVTAILKGSPAQRKEVYGRIKAGDFQVCLTTYEYIIKERPMLSKIKWIHMIIDEGHRMKNVQSKLSQTLNTYYSTRYRLILTGTPLQNNLPELWALLNFVLPKIFNSIKSFDEWFSAPFANTGGEKLEMTEEESLLVIKRLHKVLRPFLLRRLKKDVESELPDKVEKLLYTKMSGLQWVMYENVKKYKRLPTETGNTQKKSNKTALQNTYMQLRKIANHPYVFPEVEEDFMTSDQVDENLIRTSGKFELLDRILPKLIATNHKVLIFFQMTEVMTIAYDFFKYRGWETCRLDGSTKADDRQELLRTFNNPESAYKIFILSTRAGGLGLNLQSADTVIIFDSDWNPHADLQAQDRAHRIGQKMEVRVLRLITSKTIEEIILERAQKKLALDGKVIQAGKFDAKTTNEEYEELLAKHFADKDDGDNEEVNELDDDELNEMIARGNEELELFNRMDAEKLALRKEQHARSGDPGPLKPTLMDHSELPAFYRRDLGAEMAEQLVNDEEAGRGRRARNEVNYGADLITDDAWLRANYGPEGGDESAPGAVAGAGLGVEADVDEPTPEPEDPAEMKRRKAQEKKKRKEMNEQLAKAEADGMPLTATSIKIKPFGQAAGAGTGAGAQDGEEGTPVGKKNKRPRISVTPSVAGDEVPVKKRKTAAAKGSGDDKTFMKRIFDDVYDMTDDIGQPLNQYFVKPVDKKQYPDYFVLIKQPICLSQIKRKFNNASYTLAMFRADMMLLFNNARTFNEEGSWVYGAAEKMQAEFLRLWEEEMGQPGAANPALAKIEDESSPGASGSSTPMFKHHAAAIPPRIKINMGASKRSKEVVASEESASEEDDDDEDYR